MRKGNDVRGDRSLREWREEVRGLQSDDLDDGALRGLSREWADLARDAQLPPDGDWTTWLLMGGRGSGKTRAGAEWVLDIAEHEERVKRIALVGETYGDVRSVMIDGESGLLALAPKHFRPKFIPSRHRVEWPNGTVAQCFSSEEPEALRGPQFGAAWCDELGKWTHDEETWDMLQFGLRLGERPRQVVTTTPRTTPLMRRLLGEERTRVTRMRTKENEANLSPAFLGAVVARYAGTRLGRQELDGELIESVEGALWTRTQLDGLREEAADCDCDRVVVGVDPPVTSGENADACGIVVVGQVSEGAVVLADRTMERATPAEWARGVAETFAAFDADRIVVEVNQGGDLVETVLRGAGVHLPIRKVRASRGKWLRAEPVAALYEQGRVRHVVNAPGGLDRLEDEMCTFTPGGGGRAAGGSPDRLDALVWALTELMLGTGAAPRVRGL